MFSASAPSVTATSGSGGDRGAVENGRLRVMEVMLLGSSLARLNTIGSGEREAAYYGKLAERVDVVLFEYVHDSPPPGLPRGVTRVRPYFANRWLQSTFGAAAVAVMSPRPDVVRTKQLWGAWAGWIVKALRRRPLVIRVGYHWSHNVIVERRVTGALRCAFFRWIETALLRRADGVMYGADVIRERLSHVTVPSITIPNGVDGRAFQPSRLEREFDVAFVGRLTSVKNVAGFVAALPKDCRTLVVGDGPQRDLVRDISGVTWRPRVGNAQLGDILARAKLFVSLSHTEGSPKALIEAIFCGCYPVVSKIPPHEELLGNLGYGELIAGTLTPEDLQRLIDVAEIDRARLDRFRGEYSIDAIVQKELAFISRFVSVHDTRRS